MGGFCKYLAEVDEIPVMYKKKNKLIIPTNSPSDWRIEFLSIFMYIFILLGVTSLPKVSLLCWGSSSVAQF